MPQVFRRGSFGFARPAQLVEAAHTSMSVAGSSARWLADPLRPSAEGAALDGATSGIPCRRIGAWAERSFARLRATGPTASASFRSRRGGVVGKAGTT
jgi:hypothetical protein